MRLSRTFFSLFLLIACGDDDLALDGGGDATVDAPAGDAPPSDAPSDGSADSGVEPVDAGPDAPRVDAGPLPSMVGGDRPAMVAVPAGYDPTTPTPLLILLHGYGASGPVQDLYFNTTSHASTHGMLLVLPNGTLNATGQRFWDGTPACCSGFQTVDDVGYLRSLIDEMAESFNVNRGRVYLLGHSNGGFMSYRMACDASDVITAIASLAGATFDDEADCTPEQGTSVLQIHGTADATIRYNGGRSFGPYPGAEETVARHAVHAGCGDTPIDGEQIDLTRPDGTETAVSSYEGCDAGLGVELWTIEGGSHIPSLQRDATDRILTWLEQWSR